MHPNRLPDFFIVGGPRCGTTTLSRCLSKHPQILFSKPKEPHYFSRISHDPSREDVETAYLARYFPHDGGFERAIGEGSVSYLYSHDAVRRILSLSPEAKFLAIVRDPLRMLPSYHLRMLFITVEDVEDFRTAWFLQDRRLRGERLPRGCIEPLLLQYREVARFGEQVERLYDTVGREQALVLLFDDFVRDPRTEYLRVLDFLGVDDDGRTEFPTKLPSRTYRHRSLQRLMFQPKPGLEGAVISMQRRIQEKKARGRKSLLERIARWNTVERSPAPLDAEMKQILRETFRDDVEKLAGLLGRDLGHWLRAGDERPSGLPTGSAGGGQRTGTG